MPRRAPVSPARGSVPAHRNMPRRRTAALADGAKRTSTSRAHATIYELHVLNHQILLVLDAEHGGAEVAAGGVVLVRDVLPAGGDVGEDAAERQIIVERGAAG